MSTKILIKHGDTVNHTLVLDPTDTVWVDKGKRVVWSIDKDANVDKFKILKKDSSVEIFLAIDPPPSKHTQEGGGRVHWLARNYAAYDYSIYWRHKNQPTDEPDHIFDPKISVNPTDSFMKVFIGLVVALFLAIVTFGLLQQKSKGK